MLNIGIDLGTTNSIISIAENGKAKTLPIAPWHSPCEIMPSIVDFSDLDNPRVCKEVYNAKSIVYSIKRKMGENIKIFGKSPSQISAIILSELKSNAEKIVNNEITSAVITVPAYFDDMQRIATKFAASLAGIKVLRLINEPTAAAIAYGLDKKATGIYAVYDFGGGTFDFSVLRIQQFVFQVLATLGDTKLGGDDIDNDIAHVCCAKYGIVFDTLSNEDRLKCITAARELKEGVSKSVYLSLEGYTAEFFITDEELSGIFDPYIERTIQISQRAIDDAQISEDELNGIILIGGMTKSEYIREFMRKAFTSEILCGISPEETVSLGAALHAEAITSDKSKTLLIDVTPLSLGIETLGGGMDVIIPRNSPVPFEKSVTYTTAKSNQAAIIFNVLQGESNRGEKCRSLAKFQLTNIPPMGAGKPKIVVTFKVDINGILSVDAHEQATGIQQNILIEPANGLSEEGLIKMIQGI